MQLHVKNCLSPSASLLGCRISHYNKKTLKDSSININGTELELSPPSQSDRVAVPHVVICEYGFLLSCAPTIPKKICENWNVLIVLDVLRCFKQGWPEPRGSLHGKKITS